MKNWIKALFPFALIVAYFVINYWLQTDNSYAMFILLYCLFGIICEMIFIFKTGDTFNLTTWRFIDQLIFWPYNSVVLEIPDSIKFFKYKLTL